MYASPEALAKNSLWKGSSDIWSVGVTILEMILGTVPWSTVPRNEIELVVFLKMGEIIEAELTGISPPSPLKEILDNALIIDPIQRHSADQLLYILCPEMIK